MDIPKAVAPVTILPHFLNLPSSVSFLKNCQFGWKLGPSKTAEPTGGGRGGVTILTSIL